MDEEKNYEGKKVRIILKNGYRFTGVVFEHSEERLLIEDKFGNEVLINLGNIDLMEVLNEKTT